MGVVHMIKPAWEIEAIEALAEAALPVTATIPPSATNNEIDTEARLHELMALTWLRANLKLSLTEARDGTAAVIAAIRAKGWVIVRG